MPQRPVPTEYQSETGLRAEMGQLLGQSGPEEVHRPPPPDWVSSPQAKVPAAAVWSPDCRCSPAAAPATDDSSLNTYLATELRGILEIDGWRREPTIPSTSTIGTKLGANSYMH